MTNKNDNVKGGNQGPSQTGGNRHTVNDSNRPALNRNESGNKSGNMITQSSMTPSRPGGNNPDKK